MKKLPPIEKIYEAYSALIDGRVAIKGQEAQVLSSDRSKTYTVSWQDSVYKSNDNATYWQGYAGYPILAVLMLQGKLPFDCAIAEYFKEVDWTALNLQHKRNYQAALDEVFRKRVPYGEEERVRAQVQRTYEAFSKMELEIKKGRMHSFPAKPKKNDSDALF